MLAPWPRSRRSTPSFSASRPLLSNGHCDAKCWHDPGPTPEPRPGGAGGQRPLARAIRLLWGFTVESRRSEPLTPSTGRYNRLVDAGDSFPTPSRRRDLDNAPRAVCQGRLVTVCSDLAISFAIGAALRLCATSRTVDVLPSNGASLRRASIHAIGSLGAFE